LAALLDAQEGTVKKEVKRLGKVRKELTSL